MLFYFFYSTVFSKASFFNFKFVKAQLLNGSADRAEIPDYRSACNFSKLSRNFMPRQKENERFRKRLSKECMSLHKYFSSESKVPKIESVENAEISNESKLDKQLLENQCSSEKDVPKYEEHDKDQFTPQKGILQQ